MTVHKFNSTKTVYKSKNTLASQESGNEGTENRLKYEAQSLEIIDLCQTVPKVSDITETSLKFHLNM